ncbi:hypothetical protein JCM17380_13350 [Desulfosporosinus burensis]
MFKKTKALAFGVVLSLLVPTSVLGALLPTDKSFGGAEVVPHPDGRVIEYYKDSYGKVYTDLPKVIRTVIPGEDGNTIKYDANLITNEGAPWMDHTMERTGAYLTVSNVLRESVMHDQRLLYAKAPVSLTFSGDYFNCRNIIEFTRFEVESGRVLYNIGFDHRKMLSYSTEVSDISAEVQTKTISKPGMYMVELDRSLGIGVHAYIYVTAGTEDVSYVAPIAETATGTLTTIKVDSKEFNSSVYNIAGDNYVKVRDLASMLNGTAKRFDIAHVTQTDLITIKTADYNSAYTAVGGELTTVASGTKTANPTKQTYAIDGSEIKPLAYEIDGSNYVNLRDLAKIVDFDMVSSGTTITINTTTGYSGIGGTPVSNSLVVGSTERLAGFDRYATAVAISRSGWSQSESVILADGNTYHDALVGSSFAYLKNAPMLITPSDVLNSDTSAEITRLGVKTVYILGSYKSVSQAVEDSLKQQYTVIRIGGADVHETAVRVAEEVGKLKQFDTVALATYLNFPDALALAPFAAKNTMPILFSGVNALGVDAKTALQAMGVKNVIIAGGTGVIASGVETELASMGISVTRLAGYDRYDTCLEIIKHFAPQGGYTTIAIATGENYPDALTGSVLAAKNNTPLVLVERNSVKGTIADYIKGSTVNKAYIFGGTAVVSTKLTGN